MLRIAIFAAIASAPAVTVLVAVILPARRAARLEIVKALRVD
jgi:ABC-type lipoprotein release transport system permease subunit